MIVKDESHVIVETLKNLAQYIRFDTYAISDTGSTDDTKALIKAFFDEQGIAGDLFDDPWVHFGHNRSVAFQHAYKKADYSFVWDADDRIHGTFKLPTSLTADSYTFTFGAPSCTRYSRAQLFNSHKVWKYVGVLHEYPRCEEVAGSPVGVVGPYWFESNRTGARNKDPLKYAKDAAILDKAFHKAVEEKDPLTNRYAFYCAQSYRSANNLPKAIEFYKKVLALEGNWAQERYNACIELYMMCEEQKRPEEGLHWLVESHKYDKTRVEGVYRLIQYYCIRNQPDVAFAYYTLIQEHYEKAFRADLLQQYLFAKVPEYTFYLPYYMIIVTDRVKRTNVGVRMFQRIFAEGYIPPTWWVHNVFNNLQFFINSIPAEDRVSFVQAAVQYVDRLRLQNVVLESKHHVILEKLIGGARLWLSAPNILSNNRPIGKGPEAPQILLTFTTCKRWDLFQQTMYSIQRCWTDFQKVDQIVCVDDNSSEEDRKAMETTFPFIEYVWKGPENRGHRPSMNMIYNVLCDRKPTYWIHMEDDWLFFKKEAYVTRAIQALTKYESQNVHQVVFNRNYGVVYTDMDRVGGTPLEPGLLLHQKVEGLVGKNCGYWPHYSLQPSLIRASVIRTLGNYDSPNRFFERDYADRYYAKGYRTAFFDTMCSVHIGKQHWESEGKSAYELNEDTQIECTTNMVITPSIHRTPTKNLLYMCVFNTTEYLNMFKLFLISIKLTTPIDTMDVMVMTDTKLEPFIREFSTLIGIPLDIMIIEGIHTGHAASSAKLNIFEYTIISKYSTILYLDIDIIVQKDISTLFKLKIEDKLYASRENTIGNVNHGECFFRINKSTLSTLTPAINCGTFLFKNTPLMKELFTSCKTHMNNDIKNNLPIPPSYEQPYMNYHFISTDSCNSTLLTPYIYLYGYLPESTILSDIPIIHFIFIQNKFKRMATTFTHYLNRLCETPQVSSPFIGRTYTWNNDIITFNTNGTVTASSFAKSTYRCLEKNCVEVSWVERQYVFLFTGDYSKCIAIQKGDCTMCVCTVAPQASIRFDETVATPLCYIMEHHGSDKGSSKPMTSWHNYTTLYHSLLKDRRSKVGRVFELGLGTTDVSIPSNMGPNGKPGASLRGWAEYFPQARIFGADIDKRILFEEGRIKTYYCDQLDPNAIRTLWSEKDLEEGFDLIVEDGLHTYEANVCFFENSIHKLNQGGLYIIENINVKDIPRFTTKQKEWKKTYPELTFELIRIPSTRNPYHNTVLVATKMRLFETRRDMMEALVPTGGTYAEIGIFQGTFAKYLHTTLKPSKLVLLDLFSGRMGSGDQDGNGFTMCNLDTVYSHFINFTKDHPEVVAIKGDSSTELGKFEDNSFDMIYIDGDHSYEGCKKDLEVAFRKLKRGGFLMGHDYEMNMKKAQTAWVFGVHQAVDEFCQTHRQQILAKGLDGCVSFAIQIQKD
jgi:predicted O-methyltransferase YrrM/tetratricopeptide (TPR) repeat protein